MIFILEAILASHLLSSNEGLLPTYCQLGIDRLIKVYPKRLELDSSNVELECELLKPSSLVNKMKCFKHDNILKKETIHKVFQ